MFKDKGDMADLREELASAKDNTPPPAHAYAHIRFKRKRRGKRSQVLSRERSKYGWNMGVDV